MKQKFLVCLGALCCAIAPASAQNSRPETSAASMPMLAAPIAPNVSPIHPSLSAHLQMQAVQIEQMNRLHHNYTAQRLKHEANIAQWRNQLLLAQSPASFDEEKAARLLRDINQAQQKADSDFLSTRSKALKLLSSLQRSQLESLAADNRAKLRDDIYYQLLVMPIDAAGEFSSPTMAQSRASGRKSSKQRVRNNGSGSYGVYGGYGYGQPNYGVYGNYGQDGVGVHLGIGHGGPSIGVGIGSVFGGIFGGRRRY